MLKILFKKNTSGIYVLCEALPSELSDPFGGFDEVQHVFLRNALMEGVVSGDDEAADLGQSLRLKTSDWNG